MVQLTLQLVMVILALLTLLVVVANFLLTHLKTPRSNIRIDQLSDDKLVVDPNTNPDRVALNWDFTAINDGKRDGNLADLVFIDATFSDEDQDELVTSEDLGRGSVHINFQEKVASLSNDKIRIQHELSKQMGIHEYITEYDTMTCRYSILVEDGITPYKIEAEGTSDISGITIRWDQD